MEIKNHRITLRGCLLIWLGISIVLVKDTKEDGTTAEIPITSETSTSNVLVKDTTEDDATPEPSTEPTAEVPMKITSETSTSNVLVKDTKEDDATPEPSTEPTAEVPMKITSETSTSNVLVKDTKEDDATPDPSMKPTAKVPVKNTSATSTSNVLVKDTKEDDATPEPSTEPTAEVPMKITSETSTSNVLVKDTKEDDATPDPSLKPTAKVPVKNTSATSTSNVLVKDTKEDDATPDPSMKPTAKVPVKNTSATSTSNAGASMGFTEVPMLTPNSSLAHDSSITVAANNCHIFQCMGESCYKNESAKISSNTTCLSYCEMFRYNSSFYEKKCNDHCMHHICNSTQQDNCALQCCSPSQCFNSDDMNGGNRTMENKTAIPTVTTIKTTASTTSTTTIQYSDKKCRSFTCSGTDCYKSQTTASNKQCQVGIVHCELQKKVTNGVASYEGGCSNTCATSTKSCATITNADCFQECCNATNTACCMMLDGQVHFNAAAQIHNGSVIRMLTCVFIVIFLMHLSSSRV
ncbi:uncharacterized protein ACMZJ9_001216 [Mantella aurantiaca]